MEKLIDKLLDYITDFSIKFVVALLAIIIGFKLVKFFVGKIQKGIAFKKLEKSSQTFISSMISIALKVLVFIIAISILGIPMTSIITILGSFGLALGLALQGGLSNIAGGVMIMVFKPFKVGDYIDTHTDSGTVKAINIFHTIITTIDNRTVVLPNGNLSNSVVINYTAMPERRVDIDVSVSYNSDIDKVKEVLYKVSDNCKYRLENKETMVRLMKHGDGALIFTYRMWVKTSDYWNARFELLETIKKEFDKNNISIPYQQLDVHIDK